MSHTLSDPWSSSGKRLPREPTERKRMWSPAQSDRAPGLAPSSSAWREVNSPQLGRWVRRCPGSWGLGVLPEGLVGAGGGWHVQWLLSGLCPQVTWGGTRQAGLYPRARPSLACDVDSCEQWPLVEGKVPSQVFHAFSLNKAWEGRVLSSPAQRGSRRTRVSRDPRVRRYIPGSWKETRHKLGGSVCQGQSPLGTVIGSLPESLGNKSHRMSHVSLSAGSH